jgi:hypothetical protein
MNNLLRVVSLAACCGTAACILSGCGQAPPVATALAPTGPADLGPATGLSTPPEGAIVFDLKYRPQTGSTNDLQYRAFWGYGGSAEEAKDNPFLSEVRKKVSQLHYVQNPTLKTRTWAAVEVDRKRALALYFDLNGNGKLEDSEKILPVKQEGQQFEFITPDFQNPKEGGGEALTRVLLQVNFYSGSEPNTMWSPAALMEGTALIDGKPSRLFLYANHPAGVFDVFGSSSFSLMPEAEAAKLGDNYVPREQLSSLVLNNRQFYHLTIDGQRSNGLPARAVLLKDTTPTGSLAVKLVGSNALQTTLSSLNLRGVDEKTVFFRMADVSKKDLVLPEGAYALSYGGLSYGTSGADWKMTFSEGPSAQIKASESTSIELGTPTLAVRAVKEEERYRSSLAGSTTFKKGTKIYLEPKVTGKNKEVFSRFSQLLGDKSDWKDRPPSVTITGPDGKQLHSSTMEYG